MSAFPVRLFAIFAILLCLSVLLFCGCKDHSSAYTTHRLHVDVANETEEMLSDVTARVGTLEFRYGELMAHSSASQLCGLKLDAPAGVLEYTTSAGLKVNRSRFLMSPGEPMEC